MDATSPVDLLDSGTTQSTSNWLEEGPWSQGHQGQEKQPSNSPRRDTQALAVRSYPNDM